MDHAPEKAKIHREMSQFFDEVLYAVLDACEELRLHFRSYER